MTDRLSAQHSYTNLLVEAEGIEPSSNVMFPVLEENPIIKSYRPLKKRRVE